jgi:hypothetical protein
MTVRYHHRFGRLSPDYVCQQRCIEEAEAACQRIPGTGIDEEVGRLLVQSVTPLTLEVALNVQDEIQTRLAEADRLRGQQLQRAQYEADRARVRYMRVDPNNRLVADTLEAQWNEKLRLLDQAKEECEAQQRADSTQLTAEQRSKIMALAADFPTLWHSPATSDRDRKRMARLLLEDVTLRRDQEIIVQIRFKGGATQELQLPLPKSAWALRKTKPEIIAEIDRLLDTNTEKEVAQILNECGWHSSAGNPYTQRMVHTLRYSYHLKTRLTRLRSQGLLSPEEIGPLIGSVPSRVNYWRLTGVLKAVKTGAGNGYVYYKPTEADIALIRRRRLERTQKKVHSTQSSL